MSNYYKAEDVQRILCGWCGVCANPTVEDLLKCDDICPEFAQIPAADVRPVVRGKWEQTKDEFGIYNKCSACGKEYYCGPIAPFNFCPNCGADMREVFGDE